MSTVTEDVFVSNEQHTRQALAVAVRNVAHAASDFQHALASGHDLTYYIERLDDSVQAYSSALRAQSVAAAMHQGWKAAHEPEDTADESEASS